LSLVSHSHEGLTCPTNMWVSMTNKGLFKITMTLRELCQISILFHLVKIFDSCVMLDVQIRSYFIIYILWFYRYYPQLKFEHLVTSMEAKVLTQINWLWHHLLIKYNLSKSSYMYTFLMNSEGLFYTLNMCFDIVFYPPQVGYEVLLSDFIERNLPLEKIVSSSRHLIHHCCC
jgi:hypothetical protein